MAIGWPGQWTVQLLLEDKRGLSLQGGMSCADPQQHSYDNINDAKLLDTFLKAGEEIRLPLVVLMDWEAGSWLLAQNKWRRWMVDFNLPRFGGSLPTPIMPTTGDLSLLPDQGQETSTIAIFSNRGTTRDRGGFYTHWWVDAGWYAIPQGADQTWYYGVGDWFPDPKRFPKGFGTTFSQAARHDMKSLLWSEPERVMPGTDLYKNHRDWLIAPPSGSTDDGYLLNLGNADAWDWVVERFNSIIETQAAAGQELQVFRQDFNMDPLPYWNAADVGGRSGMTQVKHVMGHLAFWDELRRRHPRHVVRQLRLRRAAQRPRDDAPVGAAAPQRLSVRTDRQPEPDFRYLVVAAVLRDRRRPATNGGAWGSGQYVMRRLVGSVLYDCRRPQHRHRQRLGGPHQREPRLPADPGRLVVQRLLPTDRVQPEGRRMDGVTV